MTTIAVRRDVELAELARLAERLKAQFAPEASDEEVERSVSEAAADLAGAPIRLFVPLLVEKGARERLRARVAGHTPEA